MGHIFLLKYIHLWYGAFIELGYQTDRGPTGLGQYDGQGVYCGLSTASEVFLIFTTQIYTCLCNYNATFLTSKQEGSIATGILLTPNTPLSSLPVGSKTKEHLLELIQWNIFTMSDNNCHLTVWVQSHRDTVSLGKYFVHPLRCSLV